MNIKEQREAKGMTQQQLADAAHVKVGYISALERGAIAGNPERLEKIAVALETTQHVTAADKSLISCEYANAQAAAYAEGYRQAVEDVAQNGFIDASRRAEGDNLERTMRGYYADKMHI